MKNKIPAIGILALALLAAGVRCSDDEHPEDSGRTVPVTVTARNLDADPWDLWIETLDLAGNRTRPEILAELLAFGEERQAVVFLEPSTASWIHRFVLRPPGIFDITVSASTPVPVLDGRPLDVLVEIDGGILRVTW